MVAMGAASCGGDEEEFTDSDAQALCRQYVDTLCEKIYECLSDDELAAVGFPETVAACKTQLRDSEGCDAYTAAKGNCEGSEVFKKDKADACIRQVGEASCNQVSSEDTFAPACEETCKVE
jgi:hypothetical protein